MISKFGSNISNILYKPGLIVRPIYKISSAYNFTVSLLSQGSFISRVQWTNVSSKSNSRVYFLLSINKN